MSRTNARLPPAGCLLMSLRVNVGRWVESPWPGSHLRLELRLNSKTVLNDT